MTPLSSLNLYPHTFLHFYAAFMREFLRFTLLNDTSLYLYGANATENITLQRTLAGPDGTGVDGWFRPLLLPGCCLCCLR